MSRKVKVKDGESIDSALNRLRRNQAYEFKRWTKKRYGYYEKPSELRRKNKKMARIWESDRRRNEKMIRIWLIKGNGNIETDARNRLHLFIGLKELFARTGPSNAAGY